MRLDRKAAAAEKRLGAQTRIGLQPGHARLLGHLMNLRHQRLAYTAPGNQSCHKNARRYCAASYSASAQAFNCSAL